MKSLCLLLNCCLCLILNHLLKIIQNLQANSVGSKAVVPSNMKLTVTIAINSMKLWSIVTKNSISPVAAVLDPPWHLQLLRKEFFKAMEKIQNCSLCWNVIQGTFQEFKKDPFFFFFFFSEKIIFSEILIGWCIIH